MEDNNNRNQEKPIQNSLFQVRLPLFVSLAIAAGILIGATMFSSPNQENITKNYNKIKEVLMYIDRNYVDTVDTDDLVDYSISQLLEKLDPHSVYIPVKDVIAANEGLQGGFEGIGIEFNIFQDTIYVVAPISGGPAESVGLQAGDKIVKVDGESVAGIKIDNRGVAKRLKGEKGTKVKVAIKRRGVKKLLDFTITRDKIPQESVDVAYMLDDKTGYIKVSRFARTTYTEFSDALSKLKKQGLRQLIIDLRDNPGGYLDKAVKMADELIGGSKLIVKQDGKGTRFDRKEHAHINGDFEKGAVIVLINEGSASASEILTGALQDNDRALVVGRRSFGKGLVQMPIELSDGSELRLTIARYYTPSGRSIQKPYSHDGQDDYGNDIANRIKHGELFHADSIKFNDSLKYETAKGRVVYGGGGIMPDYFVPVDTTQNSDYYFALINQNVTREFALKYYKENQARLEKMSLDTYVKTFKVSEGMLQTVVKMAKSAGVEFDKKGFEISKKMMASHIKAWIAKSVWKEEGFYTIWHETDEVMEQALKLFGEAEKLAKGKF